MVRVGSGSEAVAKHRQPSVRFGFGRLVLQDAEDYEMVLVQFGALSRLSRRNVSLYFTGFTLTSQMPA